MAISRIAVLGEFCLFFLRTVLDQIEFMSGLLQLNTLALRIERHLLFERLDLDKRTRERLARLLKAALLEGEIARGHVPEIIGAKSTVAREIIGTALAARLIQSPSPKGALSIAFPLETWNSYFPQLFQELPA